MTYLDNIVSHTRFICDVSYIHECIQPIIDDSNIETEKEVYARANVFYCNEECVFELKTLFIHIRQIEEESVQDISIYQDLLSGNLEFQNSNEPTNKCPTKYIHLYDQFFTSMMTEEDKDVA